MADKMKRVKATSVEVVEMKSNLQNLRKWLKSLGVETELTIPNERIPTGIQHGVLFLDYLRSIDFPKGSMTSVDSLLKIMADLHDKSDPGSANAKSEKTKKNNSSKEKGNGENVMEDNALPKQGPKAAGPMKGARKLALLSQAINNLNIRDYKGCGCKSNCKTKICGCRKRNMQCNASCKCSEADCVNKAEVGQEVKEESKENNTQEEDNESGSDSASKSGSDSTNMSSENEDLEKENIDWNKHISTLVKCPKCERNFFAYRVEYHMQVCKMI